MRRNMGTVDRTLRLLVVAVIAGLYLTRQVSGMLAVVLGVIAVVSIVTSLSGWCVLYELLGVSTHRDVHAATPKA